MEESKNMERIIAMMPEGWKEATKTEKTLIRGRNIKTPEELLKLNFLYQTYGLTSTLTQSSENKEGLNKTAVEKSSQRLLRVRLLQDIPISKKKILLLRIVVTVQ